MLNARVLRAFGSAAIAAVMGLCSVSPAPGQGTREDYERAVRLLPQNLSHTTYLAEVRPHWIEKTSRFWYLKESPAGKEFLLVDPAADTRASAFDQARLAAALSKAAHRQYQALHLPFSEFEFAAHGKQIHFTADDRRWTCATSADECHEQTVGMYEEPSPDGHWAAFVRDHNLYLRDLHTGDEIALTRDGEKYWDYATPLPSSRLMVEQGTEDVRQSPAVFWSPDSSKLVTYRIDSRNAGRFSTLQFVPPQQLRPKVFTYAYPLPGENLSTAQPIIFDLPSGKRIDVQTEPLGLEFQGGPDFAWFKDGKRFHYMFRSRGYKKVELREVDAQSGKERVVVQEEAATYVDPGENFVEFVSDGAEVLWASERDGWNHLYLYNGSTGQLECQVTRGSWVVRGLERIDDAKRTVYFSAGGREPGEDPYQRHLYRVHLDGSGLEALTPEDADHETGVSPDGAFFVDTASRPDLPAVSVLRRTSDGGAVQTLEKSDVAAIEKTGWKHPEAFRGKAADGQSDTYGIIWRPSNFDPHRKYPLIEHIYTGPQASFVPKTFAAYRAPMQSVAELGFIVVMVDGRGTTGRSRAFHEFSYHNLGGVFDDHVALIRQMAGRYPYIDLARIGIYGTSAGGYAAAHAMLVHPEFYKVCVSISGDHDARLDKAWWNELYQGYPVGDDYQQQANGSLAGRLQGHLLLVHGDVDENVNPVETLRFADALMKANKDFDMLFVPNMFHGEGRNVYLMRRRWDYLVRYLLGVTPPAGFEIKITPDASE